jgi:thymidylate synthase
MSRNITDALFGVLEDIEKRGQVVVSRGGEQRETVGSLVTIDRPRERVLTVPHRHNNIFAQVAETMWVLAGRDDLKFLGRYLPRAFQFSDDGETWRAAYGPRLRAWGSQVDQLKAVRDRLIEDRYTKRAVAVIFDPARDYTETLDVPCNNWLHFLQRDSALQLNVAVRANDAIWGFSGINAFEWSVLHELMATSLGWEVGRMSWFVGTMHIYERHYEVAKRIMRHRGFPSVYEFGISPLPMTTDIDQLDEVMQAVFTVEELAHAGAHEKARTVNASIADPFFNSCAAMLRVYQAFAHQKDPDSAFTIVDELPASDLRLAVVEYLSRQLRTRDVPLLPQERDYLNRYWAARNSANRAAV